MLSRRWYDYITINVFWLGLTTISQSNGLIVPLLVQQFVGPEKQGTAFGRLRLYTLMVALLVQALMGMLSDRSTLRWGRRRPFILIGTLLTMASMLAIGASPGFCSGQWCSRRLPPTLLRLPSRD